MTIVATLLAVGIAMPAAIAVWLGAFDIPRNDSWSYRRVLWDFVATGHVRLVGWSGMTMVGQVFWTWPFVEILGKGQWVPGAAIAVASAIGLVCAYALARLLLPRAWAGGCVLLTLAVPGILLNTSSFMTDVTALLPEVACLVFGAAALQCSRRRRWALVAASLATGCFGFSIREFDLAAPAAVLVVLAVQDRRAWRAYGFAGLFMMAVCGATYVWTAELPGAHLESLSLPGGTSLRQLLASYFTLSFIVSPLLPSALRAASHSPAWSGLRLRGDGLAGAMAAAVFLGLGVLGLAKGWGLFIGNYLMQQGVTGAAVLSGARPDLFPTALWLSLQVIELLAGIALAFVAFATVANRRAVSQLLSGTVESLVAWFALLSAGGLLAYGLLVKAPLFDRYLSQLVFPVAVLLARSCLGAQAGARPAHALARTARAARLGKAGRATTVGLMLVIGAVTAVLTLNADAYDGARWQAGQVAVKAGFPPSMIDAGFEWVGAHSSQDANRSLQVLPGPAYEAWYDKLFAGFRDCAFVSGSPSPQPGLSLLRITSYDEIGFAVPEHLWVYSVQNPGCGGSRGRS